MSFLSYLFNPWHGKNSSNGSKSTQKQQPAAAVANPRVQQHAPDFAAHSPIKTTAIATKKKNNGRQPLSPASKRAAATTHRRHRRTTNPNRNRNQDGAGARAGVGQSSSSAQGAAARQTQILDEPVEFTSFPPFIPQAPDPHGTKEFLRAVIAETAGTLQQVRKAGEDIRRVNQEALKQAKSQQPETNSTTSTSSTTSAAASSLKAILARCPPTSTIKKTKKEMEIEFEIPIRPPLVRNASSCSIIAPVPPTTRIATSPGSKKNGGRFNGGGAKKKPSFFQLRLPTEPKKIQPKQDRNRRPSPTLDPRLSPLGPMAEGLVLSDDYDSDRED